MVTKGHASGRSPLSYPTAGPGSARTSDHDFLDDLTRALVDVDRDGHEIAKYRRSVATPAGDRAARPARSGGRDHRIH